MIMPFYDLKKQPFSVSGVNVFLQKPSYRRSTITKRRFNGFICVKKGLIQYTYEGGGFTLSAGSVAYVPLGSRHELEILSDSIEFYRADFTITVDGDQVLFSERPLKLIDGATLECLMAFEQLCDICEYGENTVEKTEKICTIFRILQSQQKGITEEKLLPALKYISAHYTEELDCKKLAEMCYLSVSQFYLLFKREMSKTPLEYRDGFLLKESLLLIENTDVPINDIASRLGFESVSYFSRFFKKRMGCSPAKYREIM